jgi:ADP-ribose pyrophosphatase YjhB (NUDIX family)
MPRRGGADWPRCGTSAAIFRRREVLLIERAKGPLKGLWSLPGGHIEPGEPARVAALREVREETGVVAELGGLVDIHEVLRRGTMGRLPPTISWWCGMAAGSEASRWRGRCRGGPLRAD